MAREKYHSIEPLGNFKDKGRDAIHVSRGEKVSIFAYSVREDWKAKLAEDASKINQHKHTCDNLIFVTTAYFTATERDHAITTIEQDYGWKLELYGLERLRILLEVHNPDIMNNHPQIFPPWALKIQEQDQKHEGKRHIFISHAPQDNILAKWLARKLTIEGYLVWCECLETIGDEKFPDDIDGAIENKAFRVLGLYSQHSLNHPEVTKQRILALKAGKDQSIDLLIPLDIDNINTQLLDTQTKNLKFISFKDSWAKGLQQLLTKLENIKCPQMLPKRNSVATKTLFERDSLTDQPETIFSNCFQIEQIPQFIHRFEASKKIPRNTLSIWAYRRINPTLLLSFHQPPHTLIESYQITQINSVEWRKTPKIDGVETTNIISELILKSIGVKCHELGLHFCPINKTPYFSNKTTKGKRLSFTKPDGKKSNISVTGRRKYYRPKNRSYDYLYQLTPNFRIRRNLSEEFIVVLQIGTRFTSTNGAAFPSKTSQSRKKHLTKDWWNKQWFHRTIAVAQFLGENGKIIIGNEKNEQVIIRSEPIKLIAPYGINAN